VLKVWPAVDEIHAERADEIAATAHVPVDAEETMSAVARSTGSHRLSLAARAALAFSLLAGLYLFALSVIAVSGGALVYMAVTGDLHLGVLIGAVIVIPAVVRGLVLIGRRQSSPGGIPTDRRRHPDLWAVIDDVAAEMNTPPPHAVVLDHAVNAAVREDARLLGLASGRRVLRVGMGALNVLTVDQFRAVLAHEYGHCTGGETRLGPLAYRMAASIQSMAAALEGNRLVGLIVAYARLVQRVTMKVCRSQELCADRAAVDVGGKAAFATALRAVHGGAGIFRFFLDQYVVPVWERGHAPESVYAGFQALLDHPARREQIRQYLIVLEQEPGDPGDTHPSLRARLLAIGALAETAETQDRRLARLLLEDPDGTEREVSAILGRAATGKDEPELVTWGDTADQVWTPFFREDAALLEAAAARLMDTETGLAAVLDVLEAGRAEDLALLLEPDLYEVEADGRAHGVRRVLAQSLFAAVGTALQEVGCRWQLNWAGPTELRAPDGRVIDVWPWVLAALDGAEGRTALRDELASSGLIASYGDRTLADATLEAAIPDH
jgi:Zn-dependent protease with chaperone function